MVNALSTNRSGLQREELADRYQQNLHNAPDERHAQGALALREARHGENGRNEKGHPHTVRRRRSPTPAPAYRSVAPDAISATRIGTGRCRKGATK